MVENQEKSELNKPTLRAIHIYSRYSQSNTKTVKEYVSANATNSTQKHYVQQRIKTIGQLMAKPNGSGAFARSPNF